ncbi:hypothetical protein R5R35_012913 [Gryllus longicercus]|uniref:Uncharacterized protein n=1 Tax=Gryllus longicercus TaxID=2509291 RepID=A0AAN9V154_9ORTH
MKYFLIIKILLIFRKLTPSLRRGFLNFPSASQGLFLFRLPILLISPCEREFRVSTTVVLQRPIEQYSSPHQRALRFPQPPPPPPPPPPAPGRLRATRLWGVIFRRRLNELGASFRQSAPRALDPGRRFLGYSRLSFDADHQGPVSPDLDDLKGRQNDQ